MHKKQAHTTLCTVTLLLCILPCLQTLAQTDTATHVLSPVIVKAYEQNTTLLNTAAAVNTISPTTLQMYNNTSILPAVNTAPGVRMEERSPGSYRFSIRGSALESPFGVRNVKVYYNSIPYTDPGGNTYLNQLGFYNMQSIEIIKGPGSSLYGAGTGGVLLINSFPADWLPGASVSYIAGSYNLSSTEAEIRLGDSLFQNTVRYQHLSSDGYRQQSALKKDALSWDALMHRNNRSELSAHFFYGDMTYQTPGALTITEYNTDASQARPATGAIPSAIDAKAAIYQKVFLSGFTYRYFISQHWMNSTTAYGYYAQVYNPNIRNYSRTSEPNFGGRTVFKYKTPIGGTSLQWTFGAEAQQGFTVNRTYGNASGNPGLLQSEQDINNRQAFVFSQLSWQIKKWIFTAAASLNQLKVNLSTPATANYTEQERTFNNQIAPRLAILYKINTSLSVYATAEKGFSAPTISELAPTGSQVNFNLNPEEVWNYELGTRGYALDQRLSFNLSAFYFSLTNTIVQRKDSAAGDYYINAGSTGQSGLELYLNYLLFRSQAHLVKSLNAWLSYTAADYRYLRFNQLGNDYGGNKLPGIAPNTISVGMNLEFRNGLYLNISNYYSDQIPLNDANSENAKAYNLLDAKLGYKNTFQKYQIDLFVGVNNILNEKYSLGNDINAAGGRYYNAAAHINYYAGITLGFIPKTK